MGFLQVENGKYITRKFYTGCIRNPSGLFSIFLQVKIMTSFLNFHVCLCKQSVRLYNEKKTIRCIKEQYFTLSLCSFVKYCFYLSLK